MPTGTSPTHRGYLVVRRGVVGIRTLVRPRAVMRYSQPSNATRYPNRVGREDLATNGERYLDLPSVTGGLIDRVGRYDAARPNPLDRDARCRPLRNSLRGHEGDVKLGQGKFEGGAVVRVSAPPR